ncbi:MAG: hypothetical protein MUC59_16115 [Saprospiraceae bacterium]|nr:hypothetical protein [Saprospiraceae bacterium]
MENLLLKYNRLDQFSQKLVEDFVELLIKRQTAGKSAAKKRTSEPTGPARQDKSSFDYQAYKKQLLTLRPWTSEDIKAFDEDLALFKNMTLKEW